MNKNPEISVLMACFNASEWLEDAINSVLSQTFRNFEFIIVDDGSTDDTLNIINKFCNIDNRIVLIINKHSGLARSLNIGIKAAKGEWIARIDADDICKLNRLERQFSFVRSRSRVVFVGSDYIEMNSNYQVTTRYSTSNNLLLKYLQTARKFPPHSSAFFLRSAALSVGCYRPRFDLVQDRDLWLRMSEIGEMACLDEVLVVIRHHKKNVSNNFSYMHQRAFSYMAMVSYFIRKMKFIDPLEGSELDFLEFKKWFLYKLKSHGVINRINIREYVKYSKIKFPNNKNSYFFLKIAFKPYMFINLLIILKTRLFGSNLPYNLARDWIKYKEETLQYSSKE